MDLLDRDGVGRQCGSLEMNGSRAPLPEEEERRRTRPGDRSNPWFHRTGRTVGTTWPAQGPGPPALDCGSRRPCTRGGMHRRRLPCLIRLRPAAQTQKDGGRYFPRPRCAPDRNRTDGLPFRRGSLYPTELQRQVRVLQAPSPEHLKLTLSPPPLLDAVLRAASKT